MKKYFYIALLLIAISITLLTKHLELSNKNTRLWICNDGNTYTAYIRTINKKNIIIINEINESSLKCLKRHIPFSETKISIAIANIKNIRQLESLKTLNKYLNISTLIANNDFNLISEFCIKNNILLLSHKNHLELKNKNYLIKIFNSEDNTKRIEGVSYLSNDFRALININSINHDYIIKDMGPQYKYDIFITSMKNDSINICNYLLDNNRSKTCIILTRHHNFKALEKYKKILGNNIKLINKGDHQFN